MSESNRTRRDFVRKTAACGAALLPFAGTAASGVDDEVESLPESFLIDRTEVTLRFAHLGAARRLSFHNFKGPAQTWRKRCLAKLGELINVSEPSRCEVRELRRTRFQGVDIRALVMQVSPDLSIPGYLLVPASQSIRRTPVIGIHGHGVVEPLIGVRDDGHHRFGLELARSGHVVLCPEHRGFGVMRSVSAQREGTWLEYWSGDRGRQFTLATESFLYGQPMIGQTVNDLLRWEQWLSESKGINELDVVGLSYGGDLALLYPVFSRRVRRIFASGTFGSFSVIYSRCYNAPAHCIPGILNWMDRSDIAGLNAPRPITVHYGELDKPGPKNSSAAYNESVEPAVRELRTIYRAFNAENAVRMVVTPGKGHEMDLEALQSFLGAG
jgi:dienelactone hydrolase